MRFPSAAELRAAAQAAKGDRFWPRLGRVRRAEGAMLEATGIEASLGEECLVAAERELLAEVVGFRGESSWLMPVDETVGIAPGALVRPLGRKAEGVVEGTIGRVLDALGRPLDGGPPPKGHTRSLHQAPPPPLARARVEKPLWTGVRVLDACLTLGQGQRVGLFAGAGVGKSTLLGMIARFAEADAIVVALVGERGREVREFLEDALGSQGRARAAVFVATAEAPPVAKIRAAMHAMATAEFRRDRGEHVLLVVDSLTRLAQARREIGLALGEPPTTKGYTPSCFSLLARFLERAGPGARGAISAVFTVLVEGDEIADDPVADAAMAVLDGHIVLSRAIAARGRYPAVDLLASVSRVAERIAPAQLREDARVLQQALAAFAKVEDLVALGAYEPGSDPWVDRVLAHREELERFLRQQPHERADPEESARALHALAAKLSQGGKA